MSEGALIRLEMDSFNGSKGATVLALKLVRTTKMTIARPISASLFLKNLLINMRALYLS